MIRTLLGIMLGLILLSLGMAILLSSDTRADEPNDPSCYSQSELEADVLANKQIIAGAAYYDGINSDATIIVQGVREILAFGFKDGCMIGVQGIDLTVPKVVGNPA